MSDSLSAWLTLRSTLVWRDMPDLARPLTGARDGHRYFLDTHVRERDPNRAARLHAALDLARADAQIGGPLTLARMAAWHRRVLPTSASTLRRTDAFAKRGRERYGVDAETERRFRACLREADCTQTPLTARVARAYLDVLFFHPFADGNARLAALTLDFVLARERVLLDQVAPLLMVSRPADHAVGPHELVRLLIVLANATRARASGVPGVQPCDSPRSSR